MSLWKIKGLSSRKLHSEYKWQDLEELWKSSHTLHRHTCAQNTRPLALMQSASRLPHEQPYNAQTHTHRHAQDRHENEFMVIECSVEWAAGNAQLQDICTDKADGQIISLSLPPFLSSSFLFRHRSRAAVAVRGVWGVLLCGGSWVQGVGASSLKC